jgi:NTP pyrophosphatase (non-canonical NTP hydrolase)
MDISTYQRWFADYDRQRSFDLVEPSQVVVHMMEEVGEIAREVLYLEGYRNPAERENSVALLSAELGDALVFLTKIAIHYGIDLQAVLDGIVSKASQRWPLDVAEREMGRYIEHQDAAAVERSAAWRRRHPSSSNPKNENRE